MIHGRRISSDKILFEQNCISCKGDGRKKVLVKRSWTSEGLSYFSHDGGPAILTIAEQRGDEELARHIRGYEFFTCEARYHKHCRIKYIDRSTWQSTDEEAKQEVKDCD